MSMAVTALVISALALLTAVAATFIALRQARAADRSAAAADESARAAAATDARDADRRADELAERDAEPERRIAHLRASVDLAMDSRFANVGFSPGWTQLRGGTATIAITNPGGEALVLNRVHLFCVQGDGPVAEQYVDAPDRTVVPGETLTRHLSDVTVWVRSTSAGTTELAESFVELDVTDTATRRWSRDRTGRVTLTDPAP